MDRKESVWVGMDWIHLEQNKDQWMAFVKVVMNFWVP
jgi:hypothetical protein